MHVHKRSIQLGTRLCAQQIFPWASSSPVSEGMAPFLPNSNDEGTHILLAGLLLSHIVQSFESSGVVFRLCNDLPLRFEVHSMLQDWLNLMLLVSGAAAVSLTLGLFPEDQVVSGVFTSLCFCVIYSLLRGKSLREQVLCPLIDMANYKASLDGEGAELSYEFFSNSYTVCAGDTFMPNKEVFISYGDQIADSLLQRFGFVDTDATEDKYAFYDVDKALKNLPEVSDEKWKVVESAVESEKVPSFSKMVTDSKTRIDDRVLGALRFLLGVSDDLDKALDMKPSSSDRVVFEFILKLALAEEGASPEALKQQKSALAMAKKLGKDREIVAHQYNIAKFTFLTERIVQLRRRIEKMS